MSEFLLSLNVFAADEPFLLCAAFFVLGICVGSFLNVLALRSLKEESLVWPSSYCPQCKHSLSALDNIPLLSYLILQGKCRYCKGGISFQYPLVEFLTGLIYAALAYFFLSKNIPLSNFDALNLGPSSHDFTHDLFEAIQAAKGLTASAQSLNSNDLYFYKYGLFIGCLIFASTLIAVTVTDFREKLIPHEITYPSMLIGIVFSAFVRGDLLGAMAGIGASYIIFDFMAFYGLKLYMLSHKDEIEEENNQSREEDPQLDGTLGLAEMPEEEPIEVMGGGDAVLSAVMAAYLGWKGLLLALVIGFIAGTAMGLVLLFMEMKKAGLLKECARSSLIWASAAGLLLAAFTALLVSSFENAFGLCFFSGGLGAVGGALLGMVKVGTRVSKPFPFGPALALGGFVAMFLIPYWLPFY
ncbi:MAG: prepilin peptidase [Candidatus Obscuribacterales bacterium]|nr:prepilin peptidase [Candidatus Obscuribacterales bacterium]